MFIKCLADFFISKRAVLCAASLLLAPPLVHAQETTLDPKAVQIIEDAADFLISHDQFAMNWFVSYDEVLDGREKITHLRSGTNLIAREQGFYSYAESGPATREYFYDGAAFTVLNVEKNAFASIELAVPFDELVDKLRERYDLTLPIWQILSQDTKGHLLEDAVAGAYLGTTRIAGEEAHHLAFSSYDHDWQVWVSTDPESPRLLMLVGTEPYEQGWPQFRAYFTDWDFDPQVAPDSFTFQPDDTAERMTWPSPPAQTGSGE